MKLVHSILDGLILSSAVIQFQNRQLTQLNTFKSHIKINTDSVNTVIPNSYLVLSEVGYQIHQNSNVAGVR